MKKWKWSAAALVILVAAVLIFFALNRGKSTDVGYSSRGNTSSQQESDTGSEDVAGNGGTGEGATRDNGETGTGESSTGEGEDTSSQKNETESTDTPVKINKKELIGDRKKPKLKNQRQTHGELSDKQKGQLMKQIVAGKPMVLLGCPEIKTPEKMQLYKLKPFAFSTEEERAQMAAMVKRAVADNPGGYSYSPALLPADFFVQGNMIPDIAKEQEPYTMMFADPSHYFSLDKNYYDTRIGAKNRFYLTQKRAVSKAADFTDQVIDAFSLGCEVAPKTYWDIAGLTGLNDSQANINYIGVYYNDLEENYYYMDILCMVDGYPIFGNLTGSGKGKEREGLWFRYYRSADRLRSGKEDTSSCLDIVRGEKRGRRWKRTLRPGCRHRGSPGRRISIEGDCVSVADHRWEIVRFHSGRNVYCVHFFYADPYRSGLCPV